MKKSLALLLTLLFAACNRPATDYPAKADGYNVLFIAVDDLNDWVGVLKGHPQARTPNIDRLASMGTLFSNAHAAAPSCNPSRVSIMTGLRPTTSGIYNNRQPWREVLAEITTLPAYFRQQGYTTLGAGKLFHPPYPDVEAWDDYFPSKTKVKPDDPMPAHRPLNGIPNARNFDWGPLEVENQAMGDVKVVDWVSAQLEKKHDRPFFLAAGIYRPHLPWYVPQKYFDNFPLDSVQLPPVLADDLDDLPEAGVEIARRHHDHERVIEHHQWQKAVQAYLAAIQFADDQVGRILDALAASPYKDSTIIVLWSDHGWHLGEKSHWRKFALWERSTHVPFIVVAPGVTTAGSRIDQPVSLLNIYPTLLDLAGLPANEKLEGYSLTTMLKAADSLVAPPVLTSLSDADHSVRDRQWRYIRYKDGSEELYDHAGDQHEWYNLAADSLLSGVKEELARSIPQHTAEAAPQHHSLAN